MQAVNRDYVGQATMGLIFMLVSHCENCSVLAPHHGTGGRQGPLHRPNESMTSLLRSGPAVGTPHVCDLLGPAQIEAFAQDWLVVLPTPFTAADEAAGFWWELSMRQVEVSRTIVFTAPRHARSFFEALIADNLDIGRPDR